MTDVASVLHMITGVFFKSFSLKSQLWLKLYTNFPPFLFLMMESDLPVSLHVLGLFTRDWKEKENFLWLSIIFVFYWIPYVGRMQGCRIVQWFKSVFWGERGGPDYSPFPFSTLVSHFTLGKLFHLSYHPHKMAFTGDVPNSLVLELA